MSLLKYFFTSYLIKHLKRRILGKLSIILVSGAVTIAIADTPLWQWLLSNLLNYAVDEKLASDFFPPLSFYLCLSFGIGLGILEYRSNLSKEHMLVDRLTELGHFSVNNSVIKIFFGSIENINKIDLVVSSEDTNLDLGSISSSSISGRLRKMAAVINERGEVEEDNLNKHISNWKTKQPNLGPYNRGTCIVSPPFEAAAFGIKAIINAVAIEKRAGMPTILDSSSIKRIIEFSVNYAIEMNYESIFIPIFGLGSGKVPQDEAISLTVEAVESTLKTHQRSVLVYLGVYKEDDNLALIQKLMKIAI